MTATSLRHPTPSGRRGGSSTVNIRPAGPLDILRPAPCDAWSTSGGTATPSCPIADASPPAGSVRSRMGARVSSSVYFVIRMIRPVRGGERILSVARCRLPLYRREETRWSQRK